MLQRRPLIAGNWKMNGTLLDGTALVQALVERLGGDTHGFDLLVCPPFTLLHAAVQLSLSSSLNIGGQDCHTAEKGAYTGDISAGMLSDLGCRYVILGHSERRADHSESDALVNSKTRTAWDAGLVAIVCVGETESERDTGCTLDVIAKQIADSIPGDATEVNTVVAYEPVWAIGTGRTATPEEAQEVHAFIRKSLVDRFGEHAAGIRILYGGSMKPSNATELLALADVDGGLIGGASLNADDFWEIAQSCA